MANDVREIYDAVLEEVKEEFEKLKPQLEEKVVKDVVMKLNAKEIIDTIAQYERRIGQLEKKIESLDKMILEIRSQISKESVSIGSNAQRVDICSKNDKYIYMEMPEIVHGYKFNGWIYYANSEMGDFLYKVREDGTENQQLTDYSINPYLRFHVENGKLYFWDAASRECSIEL